MEINKTHPHPYPPTHPTRPHTHAQQIHVHQGKKKESSERSVANKLQTRVSGAGPISIVISRCLIHALQIAARKRNKTRSVKEREK